MSDSENSEPKVVKRVTTAKRVQKTARLDELVMQPELFCHRGPKGLEEANVSDLFDSLIMEGLQVPIEYYVDKDGRKIVTKGHRRITACRILARMNTPNFSLDMEIPAIEVTDAPLPDLLVGSVGDNIKRKTIDNIGRLTAVRAFLQHGVEDARAIDALDTTESGYRRDKRIAQNHDMYNHVLAGHILPTHAAEILKAAEDAKRIPQVCKNFAAWVAGKEEEIQKKVKERAAKGLKDLSEAERQTKSFVTKELVTHWVQLIKAGQKFDDNADSAFRAGIDPESHELTIGNFKVNVAKEPAKNLARMVAQLSQVTKELLPIAKKRDEEEKQAKGGAAAAALPYDLEILRQAGLGEYADELAKSLPQDTQPVQEGEEDQSEEDAEPRDERDLAAEMEPPPENTEAEPTSSEDSPSEPGTPMESEDVPSEPGVSSEPPAPERKARPKRPAQSPKPKPPHVMVAKQVLQAPVKPGAGEGTAEVKRAAESEEAESSAAEKVDSPTS